VFTNVNSYNVVTRYDLEGQLPLPAHIERRLVRSFFAASHRTNGKPSRKSNGEATQRRGATSSATGPAPATLAAPRRGTRKTPPDPIDTKDATQGPPQPPPLVGLCSSGPRTPGPLHQLTRSASQSRQHSNHNTARNPPTAPLVGPGSDSRRTDPRPPAAPPLRASRVSRPPRARAA
jgi:hypothetical protein